MKKLNKKQKATNNKKSLEGNKMKTSNGMKYEDTKVRAQTYEDQPESHKDWNKKKMSKKQMRRAYKLILGLLASVDNKEIGGKKLSLPKKDEEYSQWKHVIERIANELERLSLTDEEFESDFKELFIKFIVGHKCKKGNERRRVRTNGEELVVVYNMETKVISTFYYWTDFQENGEVNVWG